MSVAVAAPVRRLLVCVLGVGAALAFQATSAEAAAANFEGQTIRVTQTIAGLPDPDPSFMADFVVGTTPPLESFGNLDLTIDIEAEAIELLGNSTVPAEQNILGFSFTDVDQTIVRIVGVTIGQNEFDNFGPGNIAIGDNGNTIVIDFNGVGIDPDDRLRLDVAFADSAVVPLPGALPLVLSGCGLIFAFGRRRRAAA